MDNFNKYFKPLFFTTTAISFLEIGNSKTNSVPLNSIQKIPYLNIACSWTIQHVCAISFMSVKNVPNRTTQINTRKHCVKKKRSAVDNS